MALNAEGQAHQRRPRQGHRGKLGSGTAKFKPILGGEAGPEEVGMVQ